MSGPRLICIGCGDLVGVGAPLCDDCSKFFVTMDNEPPCHLCMGGYRLEANGNHLNSQNGYVGRCLDFDVMTEAAHDKQQ